MEYYKQIAISHIIKITVSLTLLNAKLFQSYSKST